MPARRSSGSTDQKIVTILTSSFFVWLILIITAFSRIKAGASEDLLKVITLRESSAEGAALLQSPSETFRSRNGYSLGPIDALGTLWEGRVLVQGKAITEVALWVRNPSIQPEQGEVLYSRMGELLESQFGVGIEFLDVPNHGDGSEVKTSVRFWQQGAEVFLLRKVRYSKRSGVNLRRQSYQDWAASWGADESVFWKQAVPASMQMTQQTPEVNPGVIDAADPENGADVTSRESTDKKNQVPPRQERSAYGIHLIYLSCLVALLMLVWLIRVASKKSVTRPGKQRGFGILSAPQPPFPSCATPHRFFYNGQISLMSHAPGGCL